MSEPVDYADRWRWLKEVLRQPASILTDGTKVTLVAIWEAMDKDTGITTRLQATIAEATGLKTGTVKDCIAAARKAGFVESSGKGGHVYDEAGNKVPIASRYRLTLPAMVTAACSARSGEMDSKERSEREQVAVKLAASSDGDRYNTPSSSPSLSPIDSPEIEIVAPAERITVSSHIFDQVRLRLTDEPTTPSETKIADDKILWAWGSSWPSADEMVQPYPTIQFARTNVGYEASLVIGYTLESAKVYHAAHGEYPSATIIEAMGAVMHEELAQIMHRGELRKVYLARILANLGFTPLVGPEEETQRTQEEL